MWWLVLLKNPWMDVSSNPLMLEDVNMLYPRHVKVEDFMITAAFLLHLGYCTMMHTPTK